MIESSALARAEDLLKRFLSPSQRATWDADRRFVVRRGDWAFLLMSSTPRVLAMRSVWVQMQSWCVYPTDMNWVPPADRLMAMKLYLEHMPERVFQVAIRSDAGRDDYAPTEWALLQEALAQPADEIPLIQTTSTAAPDMSMFYVVHAQRLHELQPPPFPPPPQRSRLSTLARNALWRLNRYL